MNEAFVNADKWARSAIKNKWFNLKEGEAFDAQVFDDNLFVIDTVNFTNNGALEAFLGSGQSKYYVHFKSFLSENNFQIKIKESQKSIYKQLRRNNGGLKKDDAAKLSDYLKHKAATRKALAEHKETKKEALTELTIKEFVKTIDEYAKKHTRTFEIPDEIRQVFSMLVKEIGVCAARCMLSALCATYGKEPGINVQHLKHIAGKTPSKIKPNTNLALLLKEFKEKSYINYSRLGMGKNIISFRKSFNKEEYRSILLFVLKGIKMDIIRVRKNITARKLRSTLMSPEDLVTVFLELTNISNYDLAIKRAHSLLNIKHATNQTSQKKTKLYTSSTLQKVKTNNHDKPYAPPQTQKNTQRRERVRTQINTTETKKELNRDAKRYQINKHKLKLRGKLDSISENKLKSEINKYLKMNILPISSQKACILDPDANKSSMDFNNPPMIDVVILRAQAHEYTDKIMLTRLLQDILSGKLDGHAKARELKKKIFEQCGIDHKMNIKIQLSIMIRGRSASYEILIKQS